MPPSWRPRHPCPPRSVALPASAAPGAGAAPGVPGTRGLFSYLVAPGGVPAQAARTGVGRRPPHRDGIALRCTAHAETSGSVSSRPRLGLPPCGHTSGLYPPVRLACPWRKRQRRTSGGDWAKRVSSTQHHGRRDDASRLATLAHHHAGPHAILVPPAVSPGGQPLTADTRPGMSAGEALTSRARGGRLCPRGMAVRTSRALDPCV
jgi:hypothetical protein